VQVLKLKGLYCKYSLGTYLSKDQVVHLRNTSITRLDLSSNHIEMMHPEVPKYLPPNMTYLDISENRFTWGMYMLGYQSLTKLRVIDISKQFFVEFPELPFFHCENPIDCDSTDSIDATIVSPDWTSRDTLDWNASDLVESTSPHSDVGRSKRNITYTLYVPRSIQKLFFHDSNFVYTILETHLGNNNCKEYHVQNNFIHALIGPMTGMEHAEYIDISGNLINNISLLFFDSFPNITYLDLSKNLLGNVLNDLEKDDHFKALHKLKEINLSKNTIFSLPSKLLSGAVSLERLDLSNNILTNFTCTLSKNASLNHLDLSANRLNVISRHTIHCLEKFHERSNLTVDLSGNLFDCTCKTISFLQWVRDSKINFLEKDKYICKTSHLRKRTFHELNDIIRELEQDCRSNLPKTIGITVSVVALLAIGIMAAVYKLRWTIRYFFYRTKWEIQDLIKPSARKTNHEYQYSAFVMYTENDSNFVKNELVQHLQTQEGMELCLSYRDFCPGLRTFANVTHAIHNSRKIICVVTDDFLDDQWCIYQLQMALEDRLHRKDEDCIICILFKDPSQEDVTGSRQPLLIMHLIKRKVHALYPQNPTERASFWRRLIAALRE
jgi:Leucine-rich repeat (LRR) protein